MQAARLHDFGAPSAIRIENATEPTPAPGDALVRVLTSGINPIEWKIRSGAMGRALGRPLPVTLGWECAGVVEQVGAEVRGFAVGDPVFAYPEFGRDGSHAGKIAIAAVQLARKPESLSFAQAAAVPMTAQAAWTALEVAAAASGQRVLIHGAAGAVGHWLVQLAKAAGLRVVATASGDGLAAVRALGADETVDYKSTRFEEAGSFDVVFDLVGGETQQRSWGVLAPGGVVVSTVSPPDAERGKQSGREGRFVFTPPRGAVLAEIGARLDAGALQPLAVAAIRPLADLVSIHTEGEAGRSGGKTVLSIGAD